MKRTTGPGSIATVVLAIIALIAACTSSSTTTSPPTATVAGVVTDSTGAVLSGVSVTAGTVSATTAADGAFALSVAPQSDLVVGFSKTGYLASSKALIATAGATSQLPVALMEMAPPQPLDATHGGKVTGARGASLTVGPGILVDASGSPVTGTVQVSLTPLDPAVGGELAAYPGALVGSVNGGPPTLLQTFGVLDVTVTQNGQPVQVASGQTVDVTIPVATGTALPPTEDLWSFDLATGIWDHEGTAELAGSAYTAQLAHFSYHNIDGPIASGQATCVTGLVVDSSGNPVAGAFVNTGGDYYSDLGDGLVTTDSNGRYCQWVVINTPTTLVADSTEPPFGEGSITVTGNPAISFPGQFPYACANLSCQSVPNIVINRPPCTVDADCPSGQSCCVVEGQGLCLQDFACGRVGGQPLDGGVAGSADGGNDGGKPVDGGSGVDGGNGVDAGNGLDGGSSVDGGACGSFSTIGVTGTVPNGQSSNGLPVVAFAGVSGVGGTATGQNDAGVTGYAVVVQILDVCLPEIAQCSASSFFNPLEYSATTSIVVLVEELTPIVTGTPYPVLLTDSGTPVLPGTTGGPQEDVLSVVQSSNLVCTPGTNYYAGQGSSITFSQLGSTIAGTLTLDWYPGGIGSVTGSFSVPNCSSLGPDAGGSPPTKCTTP